MALKRTTRSKLYRGTMYVIFIAIVVWVIVSTNWPRLARQFFNPEVAASLFPGIITIALVNTILFTIIAFVALLVRLFQLQIVNGDDYRAEARHNITLPNTAERKKLKEFFRWCVL